jgi:CBS domain-containing protein
MLNLVVDQRVHRAYVVNDDLRPVAVATLTDLLYAMAGEAPTGRPTSQA